MELDRAGVHVDLEANDVASTVRAAMAVERPNPAARPSVDARGILVVVVSPAPAAPGLAERVAAVRSHVVRDADEAAATVTMLFENDRLQAVKSRKYHKLTSRPASACLLACA